MSVWPYIAGLGAGLNMLDAVATCIELELGLATEANPLMFAAYSHSIYTFFALKSVAAILFFVLGSCSHRLVAKIGLVITFSAYALLAVWHTYGSLL